uniref:Uncharacterized protein n=1 Tax=Trichogramma kaykai TaxID=54128 RepID=A0ABD2W7G4_9HYME
MFLCRYFLKNFRGASESNKINDSFDHVALINQSNLIGLKVMRDTINWKIKEERVKLLWRLHALIRTWDKLPDLQDIFRKEEMDHLLADSIDYITTGVWNKSAGEAFLEFVFNTDYKDEPDVDEDGKPLLRRTTAVHRAVRDGNYDYVDVLFKIYKRFDVNYTDGSGFTHFHAACMSGCEDIVIKFLELGQDPNCLEYKTGKSPLHLALEKGNKYVVQLLLKHGANPNLADSRGFTPLHIICERDEDADFLTELFFKINDEKHQWVQVDVRDMFGITPLHLALIYNRKGIVELLLRRGANQNLATKTRLTPLHIICNRDLYFDDGLSKLFFYINDSRRQSVQVNARNNLDRTPLQLAVANLLPYVVDDLLNHGADLSSFVFPSESYFAENFDPEINHSINFKLRLASGALATVESLENRGYELDQSNALTIMKFFLKYDLFEKSEYLYKFWRNDKFFLSTAKKLMIQKGFSLYDLVQLRPEEAAKKLTYSDYLEFAYTAEYSYLSKGFHQEFTEHLCEMLSRGFFRRWALKCFLDITSERLPKKFCEKVIEQLMNKDLYHICLAATGNSC